MNFKKNVEYILNVITSMRITVFVLYSCLVDLIALWTHMWL